MLAPLTPKDGLAALANEIKKDSDKGSIQEIAATASNSIDSEYDSHESSKLFFFTRNA